MTYRGRHVRPPTATQVRFPARAALRTIVQVGIPAVLLSVTLIPEIIRVVLVEPSVPEGLRVWLLGVSAAITAIAGILARIMAIPVVNEWLRGVGLSAQPEPGIINNGGDRAVTEKEN